MEERVGILIVAKDAASKVLKGVQGQLGAVSSAAHKAATNSAKNLERITVAAGALAIGAGATAVKWAGDFQAQMNLTNTVAQASPGALAAAGQGVRNLAKQYGQDLGVLTAAQYDLVSAGVQLGDTQALLNTSIKLGIGAYGSTAEAVDVLTTAMNSYNLKTKDGKANTAALAKVSDELAVAVADGKVKLSEIAGVYADVAPVAASMKIGNDQIAASLGFLTAKGNPANAVMTQMGRAMIELQKPNADLLALQKKTKINFADLASEKGLVVALETMRRKAKELGIPFQDLFGRLEGYKFALQTTGPNNAAFVAELDKVRHSAGTADEQFDERAKGFNYNLDRFRANVKDAGITIGNALLPQLSDLADQAATFLSGHQADIEHLAGTLATKLKDGITWARSLDWNRIGDALKTAADWGKKLIDTFLGMPAWAQQVLVGLFVANKFTGGAVGDLVGSVAGAVAKAAGTALLQKIGLMSVNAAVVNVKGAVVNGGGPGGAGGAVDTLAKAATPWLLTTAGQLATLAAGIALPLVMFDLIPALVPGPKQPGAGAGSQPGLHTRAGDLSPLVVSQMTGLMPGFRSYATAAGATPIVPVPVYDKTTAGITARNASEHNAVIVKANRDASQKVTADLGRHAADERTDAVEVRRAIDANRLATRGGFTAMGIPLRQIAAKDPTVNVNSQTFVVIDGRITGVSIEARRIRAGRGPTERAGL